MIKIEEERSKEGYKIIFFTDRKFIFRRAKIILNKLIEDTRWETNGEKI